MLSSALVAELFGFFTDYEYGMGFLCGLQACIILTVFNWLVEQIVLSYLFILQLKMYSIYRKVKNLKHFIGLLTLCEAQKMVQHLLLCVNSFFFKRVILLKYVSFIQHQKKGKKERQQLFFFWRTLYNCHICHLNGRSALFDWAITSIDDSPLPGCRNRWAYCLPSLNPFIANAQNICVFQFWLKMIVFWSKPSNPKRIVSSTLFHSNSSPSSDWLQCLTWPSSPPGGSKLLCSCVISRCYFFITLSLTQQWCVKSINHPQSFKYIH